MFQVKEIIHTAQFKYGNHVDRIYCSCQFGQLLIIGYVHFQRQHTVEEDLLINILETKCLNKYWFYNTLLYIFQDTWAGIETGC